MSRVTYPASFSTAGEPTWPPTSKQPYRGGEEVSGGSGAPAVNLNMFGSNPPAGTTWACASEKGYWDNQGVLRYAAIDEWFVNHDPFTLEPLGPWTEQESFNGVQSSWNVLGQGWFNAGVAPVRVLATFDDGAEANSEYSKISGVTDANSVYADTSGVFSGVGVRIEPSFIIRITGNTGDPNLEIANPTSGSVGSWIIDTSLMGDGWEWVTRNHPAVTINTEFRSGNNSDGGCWFRGATASDGPFDFDLQSVQVEENTKSTSPIKTIGVGLSRAQTFFNAASLVGLLNQTEGTLAVYGRAIEANATETLLDVNNGTAANRINANTQPGLLGFASANSGGNDAAATAVGSASYVNFGLAATWEQNDATASGDGTSGTPDAVCDFPLAAAFTDFDIGLDALNGNPYNGTLSGLLIFTDVKTDAGRDALSPAQSRGATRPLAPTGLTATNFSSTRIDLAWNDLATNESGYRIERSLDGIVDWNAIETTAPDVTTYSNIGLTPGQTYYYRVIAESSTLGDSAASDVSGDTTAANPPTVATTYPSYDIWFDQNDRETIPTPTVTDLTYANAAQLQTALDTAGGLASVGNITRVLQTASFSTSGEDIRADIHPGATVVLDGNDFNINAQNQQFQIKLECVNPAGTYGYGASGRIASVAYDQTGEGFQPDNAIVTFTAAGLPEGAAIGKILKLFVVAGNTNTSFDDPYEGAYTWCRQPSKQRFGIAREIIAINGLDVQLDGHLYEGDTKIYDTIAKSAFPLLGSILLAESNDVWVTNLDVRRHDGGRGLQILDARDFVVQDCIFDQQNLNGSSEGKFEQLGGYQGKIIDSVAYNADNLKCNNQHGFSSNKSGCRVRWIETGTPGTRPALLGFSCRNMRRAVDTMDGSFNLGTGQPEGYYAQQAGPSVEMGSVNLTQENMEGGIGEHSGGAGTRYRNFKYAAPSTDSEASNVAGGRGLMTLYEQCHVKASDIDIATSGENWVFSQNSGNSRPASSLAHSTNAAKWYGRVIDSILDSDAPGRELITSRGDNANGPTFYERNTVPMAFIPSNGFVYEFDMYQGVTGDVNAFLDDPGQLPGYVRGHINADAITPAFDADFDLVNLGSHGEIVVNSPELDLASLTARTVNMLRSQAGTLAIGRFYVVNEGGNTVALNTGAGDVSDALLTLGAAPVTVPADPTSFTATANGSTQIDLAWVAGAGDLQSTYVIDRSLTGASFWVPIVTLGPTNTAHSDIGLAQDTQYFYRIRAENGIGLSSVDVTDEATTEGTGSSSEVVAVRAILTNLTPTEDAAMETFVDQCVSDGNWSEISSFNYYGLDSTTDDKLDWLGNANAPASAVGSTSKEAHDGYRKLAANANYIDSGVQLNADLVTASLSDIICAVFMDETVDPGALNVSPFGSEKNTSGIDRYQVMIRTDDKARVFPLNSSADSVGSFTHPFSGEWMGMTLSGGTGDYIGGVPGSIGLAGIDRVTGGGTLPDLNLGIGSCLQQTNGGQDGAWECVMTATVIAKATTFDLNTFSTAMATFKVAVDGQP